MASGGAVSDLNEVSKKLGEFYKEWKEAEKAKNTYKAEFFEALTEKIRYEAQPQVQVVRVYGPTEEEARSRLAKYYPGGHIKAVDGQDGTEGYWGAVLEEDPDYVPYTFINPEDQMVYSRQVVAGKLNFDDELLKKRDPELYERVTYIPQDRQLRNLSELDDEDIAAVQEYIYEGKPIIKLGSPRKAKPEELEES